MNLEEESCDDNANLKKLEEERMAIIKSMLPKLYDIWNDVGIDLKQKEIRADVVWKHLINLLQEIIEEESCLYETIQKRIEICITKIQELKRVLCMPEEQQEEINGTLMEQDEILGRRLENLLKIKQKRLKTYQDLHVDEEKYCKIVGMPTLNLSSNTGVPNENDLHKLEKYVNMLKDERKERLEKYYEIKNKLTTIYEETELTPETLLEENVLSIDEEDRIALSNETFKDLENTVFRLQNRKANLENEKKSLFDKLTILWDRLNITEIERKLFMSKHADCRISTLKSMEAEINRYEEIKRQNIKMYVCSLKQELIDLWDKCSVSENERQLFGSLNSDEFNNEILNSYEIEVEKWRKYYESTEHILNKIGKRQKLWDLMIALESRANDPKRFKNRGGNLLQEERERNKLIKELPTLENEIFLEIENFETVTGNLFLYKGVDFRMFVRRQWEKRLNEKEQVKLTRQKHFPKQMEDEVTVGTTPCKRPLCATPSSTPNKHFKPVVRLPIYRTPNLNCKSTPNKIGQLQSKNIKKKNRKSVLKEKNGDKTSESNSLDDTSYTEFADKLNRPSRIVHRSSVLSSRKTVGTRISQNNHSRRKNASKMSLKSGRKKTTVLKTTPSRGKLGLPILI